MVLNSWVLCLLTSKLGPEVVAAALIYVDDLQLALTGPALVDSLVEEIKVCWPCTVQAADRFLGIQIEHDMTSGTLTAHQQAYIDGVTDI